MDSPPASWGQRLDFVQYLTLRLCFVRRYFLSVYFTGLNWNNFCYVSRIYFSQMGFPCVVDWVVGPDSPLQHDGIIHPYPCQGLRLSPDSSLPPLDFICGHVICFDQWDASRHDANKGLGWACMAGLALVLLSLLVQKLEGHWEQSSSCWKETYSWKTAELPVPGNAVINTSMPFSFGGSLFCSNIWLIHDIKGNKWFYNSCYMLVLLSRKPEVNLLCCQHGICAPTKIFMWFSSIWPYNQILCIFIYYFYFYK